MDDIITTFQNLYDWMTITYVPIINVTFKNFFLGLLMLELLITAINVILGKKTDNSFGKDD